MTIRELYDNVLIELNKVEAPSLLLEDFNYFANKAVQQYINKTYNRYDINQQSTDDLRTLKKNLILDVYEDLNTIPMPSESNSWVCKLPEDYMHMLNCIVVFQSDGQVNKCENRTNSVTSMARRLTSDMYPSILDNFYFKPSYKNPYYFLKDSTSILSEKGISKRISKILNPCEEDEWTESESFEIRCGDSKKWKPVKAYIDYLKVPSKISLDYEDLDSESDETDNLEFPEYVCYEILNELIKLVLENIKDPRLETNIPINQTIAGISNNN